MSENTTLTSALISDQLSSSNHSSIHASQAIPAGNKGLGDHIGSPPLINEALGRGIDCLSADINSATTQLIDPDALSRNPLEGMFDNNGATGLGGIGHQGFVFDELGNYQVEKMNEGNLVINSGTSTLGGQSLFSQSNSNNK